MLDLNLEVFLRLFVNHRPVYGITKGKIIEALDCLREKRDKDKEDSEKKDLTRGELSSFYFFSFRIILGNIAKGRREDATT